MAEREPVYLEVGVKRVFAAGIDWPGWCRSGRDEVGAIEALLAYGPRYQAALGPAIDFRPPADAGDIEVIERIEGDASTDFGVPRAAPAADGEPLDAAGLDRLVPFLSAAWAALDRAAAAAGTTPLRTGPRGGGRQLAAIVDHLRQAEMAYAGQLGRSRTWPESAVGLEDGRALVRLTLEARARGETPPKGRRVNPWWSPRYGVRRTCWHALDHAWEIEDRAP